MIGEAAKALTDPPTCTWRGKQQILTIRIMFNEGPHLVLLIASVSCNLLLRMRPINVLSRLIKVPQDILFSSAVTSSPFACISSSLGKPTPLRLDVSLPPLEDIRWSFARLLYLFNMQLERNVAT
ncbi:hypothetical protein Acr_20g0005950 [Actinidia rufa]|uniref:Uncharacterized protein n=1 Tax=Actinidia rufa TaxID=165716 RepID=A0A7J0GDA7_9ERIC|nr:hypothetical protein Acr_20g0005950 [Actinidia rufa]